MDNSSEVIRERLAALRSLMKQYGIDMYLIGSEDFHCSEYVGEYFRCRQYISGFTGSAGTLLITDDFAGLWTDGRYYIQAANELEGTGIELFKSGQENVPEIKDYIADCINKGECLGFDGRTVSAKAGRELAEKLSDKGAFINSEYDLVGRIWKERPSLPKDRAWLLEDKFSGESAADKIKKIRAKMKEYNANYHVLASLDDIAWLLNIRGNDVKCNPVVLSYLIMNMEKVFLYSLPDKFTDADRLTLENTGIMLRPYDDFYTDLKKLNGLKVLADSDRINYLAADFLSSASIIDKANPTIMLKAVKNETELKNTRNAHLMDGIALTKFMYWLKENISNEKLTEISAAEKMEEFRKKMPGYLMPSFEPISAYGENAALPHYCAVPGKDAAVDQRGFLLMDTGAQYKGEFIKSELMPDKADKSCGQTEQDDTSIEYVCGTTDITRTFVVGPLTEEEKKYFTLVLKGHLNLASAKFKKGVRGVNLDYLAREPLWKLGMDFNHGTGHGVGYLLNVHESPNSFRYRTLKSRMTDCILTEGMITSDEPGIYFEGRFGIRHENLIECVQDEKNEYGEFLRFEHLTLVPFDPDGIDEKLLTEDEKNLLEEYQKKVYHTLSPYLEENERLWLKGISESI